MTFTPPPETHASHGWRREGFEVALIGPEAMQHRELLVRAGYAVRGARRGDQAAQLFQSPEPVDVIVLDFSLQGRPPEAILLFSRRTSAAAQLIAIVPAQDADAFRRAFLAGARDVLPTPARGEDLLAAVDLLVEPRALSGLLGRLRSQYGVDDETHALPAAPGPNVAHQKNAALDAEITRLRAQLDDLRTRHDEELKRLRQQALDAVTDRDRLLDSRNEARERLADSRKELREGAAQLRMLERACEELQRKLKDSRDQRRSFEARLTQAKERIRSLEQAMREHVEQAERSVKLDMEFTEVSAPPDGLEVDVEEALAARDEDAQRLEELEAALDERSRLAARVAELESQLARVEQRVGTNEVKELSDLEEALERRAEDEERLAELDEAMALRDGLEREVERLRKDLSRGDGGDAEELVELHDAYDQTLALLDAVRSDRAGLKRRVADLEREAADALMRIEELSPLVAEVAQLRGELRTERDRAQAAKRSAGRVRTQFSQLDRASAALEDELVAAQRSMVLGRARGDVLSVELHHVRAALTDAHAARSETLQRLREAELELDSLRVTVAALSADRRSSRSRR